ncbi:type IV secretory system conjugative DNA transfer family protein, partial [Mesorhizobium sp. M0437]
PLLRPEQVRLLDDDYEIVLIKGLPPLKLRKVRYFSDRILKRIFERQTGALPEPAPLTGAEEALSAESQLDDPLCELAQDFDDTV